MSKAVKVTIFMSSMDHHPKVNEGYDKVFTHNVKPVSLISQMPHIVEFSHIANSGPDVDQVASIVETL